MHEGQREKELQLELTKPRNPYLVEQFGNRQTPAYAGNRQAAVHAGNRQAAVHAGNRQAAAHTRNRRVAAQGTRTAYAGERRVTAQGTRTVHADTAYRRKVPQREQQRRVTLARQQQKKKKQQHRIIMVLFAMLALTAAFYWLVALFLKDGGDSVQPLPKKEDIAAPVMYDTAQHPEWTTDYLTPNEYSRPGDALEEVNSIFVHYTANPGTSAANNRNYFEQLKDTHERSASAHFIIGYEGEIIQCIPLNEIAYGVQTRNFDSISIECCYLDKEEASFTKETYDALIELLAYLLQTYHLSTEDILRHYDCGGKLCPLYYVENENAWESLKQDVAQKLD